MSYILDALKKAESERRLGTIPTLHSPSPSTSMPAGFDQTSSWRHKPLLLLAVLLMALAIGVIWFKPWQNGWSWQPVRSPATLGRGSEPLTQPTTQPITQPIKLVAQSNEAASSVAPSNSSNTVLASNSADIRSGTDSNSIAADAQPSERVLQNAVPTPNINPDSPGLNNPTNGSVTAAPGSAQTAELKPAAPEPSAGLARPADGYRIPPIASAGMSRDGDLPLPGLPKLPLPNAVDKSVLSKKASNVDQAETTLPTLRQLPETVQRQIPELSFGGFLYSNNRAERTVIINRGLRHEGDEIAPGLILEKMTPHMAVLSYRGHRYRVAY